MTKRKPPSRGGRSSSKGGASFARFAGILIAAIALFGLGVWFGERLLQRGQELAERANRRNAKPAAPSRAAEPRPGARKPAAPENPPVPPTPASLQDPSAPPVARARIAIVIDDLGRDLRQVEALVALGVPLTYAILPFEPHSAEIAEQLRERGAEVLVHLPMEPEGKADPGPGALVSGMSARAAAAATRDALEQVPGATGLNNHMGSAVTADRKIMGAVVEELAERGLYFLDSRTSAESVGFEVARSAGVPAARRDLFLDQTDERAAIGEALENLAVIARSRGAAIGIAHPRPATLVALREGLPRLAAEGVEVVPVSFLLERSEEIP